MSKFNIGDTVYLFNSISCEVEQDTVYAVLYAPIADTRVEQHTEKSFKERIELGEMKVHEQCQTLQHQIVDSEILFESPEKAKAYYIDLLSI
jgi:hypothetical protein